MKFFWRILPWLAGIVATLIVVAVGAGIAAYYYLQPELPSVDEMRDIPLQIPLRIYTRDGRLMEQIGEKRRIPVKYDDIPEMVVQSFLAAEDDRFFEHPGFDYQGIVRAALKLVTTGSRAQGGSTITQQLAREYFLSRDRTFVRKAKELILAIQIESEFTKPEILALYLNKIFLGQRAYGVAAAAEVYFGKELADLSVAEAATIAGLPAAPSRLNPVSSPEQATERRSYVLRRMHELSFITDAQLAEALDTPMESRLYGPRLDLRAPYVAEMARLEAVNQIGLEAYTDGYQVVTTLDSRLQVAASGALREALLEYDRRHGFRGPAAKVDLAKLRSDYAAASGNPEGSGDSALQNHLNQYPVYTDLNVAIVTGLNPGGTEDENSAEFYLRDKGRVVVPWERLKWRPYVNDNVLGDAPKSVSDMLGIGDVVYLLSTVDGLQLAQVPESQGAFVALDPHDGATIALTGGFDYFSSKFNRATQAKRQPGSSFKPFVYSAALENGFTAATIVNDAPVVMNSSAQEEAWRPENYSNRFYGPTRLREGLVKSMNLVSVRVLREIGLRDALKHIEPFGFPKSALPRDLSLALGSGGASPWQMAEGFAGLASGGMKVDRYYVERILDAQGNVVYQAEPAMVCEPCAPEWFDGREDPAMETAFAPPPPTSRSPAIKVEKQRDPEIPDYGSVEEMIEQAANWRPDYTETPLFWKDRNAAKRIITAQNAFIVYDMMQDVILRGTGAKARSLERQDLAGKTGTSNNRRDAWFSGFNSEVVGVAWVGFDDDSRSLGAGEEGSRTALPMWIDFMATALKDTDEAPLRQPPGIVSVRIDKSTGLLASGAGGETVFEIFRAGSEPAEIDGGDSMGGGDIFVDDANDTSIF